MAAAVFLALGSGSAWGQTAFGSATTIVFPLTANTSTFTSTVTIYNPNPAEATIALDYFDANNLAAPGAKPCSDVVVPANSSVQFGVPSQCTLDASPHFGMLIATNIAGSSPIFGYSRTENNASAGFSVEGFPSANFATDATSVTGLRGSTVPGATHQSNCFVASQADPLTYEMKLFDGATGTQIGTTVSGALNAFEQIRYLDVFAIASAPPATDFTNVRAEFTRTNVGSEQMIGFCTVQDNATFGADFRIAKALTPDEPPPPPPGPSGSLAATWNGAIQSLLNGVPGLEFAGPTTPVTLLATADVSAFGGGWFSKQSSGNGSLNLGVCYQDQSGPGPVTALGSPATVVVTHTQVWQYASGSAALGAGTYNVGLCAQNIGVNSVNKNGTTSGFVFVAAP